MASCYSSPSRLRQQSVLIMGCCNKHLQTGKRLWNWEMRRDGRVSKCLLERADTAGKEPGEVILERARTAWEQLAGPPACEGFEVCSPRCVCDPEALCLQRGQHRKGGGLDPPTAGFKAWFLGFSSGRRRGIWKANLASVCGLENRKF